MCEGATAMICLPATQQNRLKNQQEQGQQHMQAVRGSCAQHTSCRRRWCLPEAVCADGRECKGEVWAGTCCEKCHH
jgi:hypothetical protein